MECTLVIDERLLEEARAALGTTSVQDTIEAGLRAAIAQRRGEALLARFDGIDFDMTDDDLRRMRRADVERLERLDRASELPDGAATGQHG
jgi:Arc/MetJ family transcription regulator